MLLGGFHVAHCALDVCAHRIICLYVSAERKDSRVQELLDRARSAHVAVQRCALDSLGVRLPEHHQGVVTKLRSLELPSFERFVTENRPRLLILDGIMDPHNLGACMRSAAAAGMMGVVLTKHRCAPMTHVVHRVSAGASLTLPVFSVASLSPCLRQCKKAGMWIVGADAHATASLYDTDLTGALAFLVGNEQEGLRQQSKSLCDFLVRIPLDSTIESLNVAAATSVLLFESMRQMISTQAP